MKIRITILNKLIKLNDSEELSITAIATFLLLDLRSNSNYIIKLTELNIYNNYFLKINFRAYSDIEVK